MSNLAEWRLFSMATIHFPTWILSKFLIRHKASFVIWLLLLFPRYPFARLALYFWGGRGINILCMCPSLPSPTAFTHAALPARTLSSTCHLVNPSQPSSVDLNHFPKIFIAHWSPHHLRFSSPADVCVPYYIPTHVAETSCPALHVLQRQAHS